MDYSASAAGVYVDLGSGKADGGDATGNFVANVENVVGSAHDDDFVGSGADNAITGGEGTDTLVLGGNFQDYDITYNKETDFYTVVDLRKGSPDGTDTVSQVERFSFADGTIDVKDPSDLVNHAPVFTSGTRCELRRERQGRRLHGQRHRFRSGQQHQLFDIGRGCGTLRHLRPPAR